PRQVEANAVYGDVLALAIDHFAERAIGKDGADRQGLLPDQAILNAALGGYLQSRAHALKQEQAKLLEQLRAMLATAVERGDLQGNLDRRGGRQARPGQVDAQLQPGLA